MLSILIPTKGRPQALERCVSSVDFEDVHILVLAKGIEDVSTHVMDDKRVTVYYGKHTVVQAQNYLMTRSHGNILPISDDVEFIEGMLDKAYMEVNRDKVLSLKVSNMDSSPYAFMIYGSRYVYKYGLFCDEYIHFYADTEAGERARIRGLLDVFDEPVLNHYHPSAGHKPDATHTFERDKKLIHDKAVYESRCLLYR